MSKRPSVLLVGNFLSQSVGTMGICERLAVQLRAKDWQVLTTSTQTNRWKRLIDMLTTIWHERQRYDIALVDVYSGLAFNWAVATCWLLRRVNKPYILVLRGGNLPLYAQRYSLRVKRLLQSADAVTTPSQYLCESLTPFRSDIRLLRNGISLENYPFEQRQRAQPKLAWLRGFHQIYDPMMAVEVLGELAHDFPEIELAMFGPDKHDGTLEQVKLRAEALGVTARLHIPGAIDNREVPAVLKPYDIYLNTTTAESFGVAVVEAAATGMCIVTTTVGELPYMWQQGINALLVPVGDSHAMAQSVRELLHDPVLAEKLSWNARQKAEQFSWETILPEWEDLLTTVAENSHSHE